jgi:hypothetical protein
MQILSGNFFRPETQIRANRHLKFVFVEAEVGPLGFVEAELGSIL